MENKMQVIISTAIRFTNEADVAAYKSLSFEALPLEDMEYNEVTRYLVGWEHIVLFGANGRRLAVLKRKAIRGMAINDKPVTVTGDGFKPFNTEDDELEELKAKLAELGRTGISRRDLKDYLRVNKSGLPVVAVNAETDEVEGTYESMTEIVATFPSAEYSLSDEPDESGRWTVGVN